MLLRGQSKCGLNVNNVIHYAWQVNAWGPLWHYLCFPFEDLNGDSVDIVHGTRDMLPSKNKNNTLDM